MDFRSDTVTRPTPAMREAMTQANLLGLMAHCERGDEYLCGQQAHNYRDDSHFARTKLLSLENTINGKVLPLSYLQEARAFVNKHNLKLHLDGARVYNAATALDVPVRDIAQYFDSMTICLSKGLGAPVGSLLLGSKEYIAKARRLRKMVGGGMRQAGILAALPGVHVNPDFVQTNIVFAKLDDGIDIDAIAQKLAKESIIITPGNPIRFVTHKDISRQDIDLFLEKLRFFLG